MKKILISSFDMEIGGVERSLISMLDQFNYKDNNVDLMLYRHQGEFMNLLNKNINLLDEVYEYSTIRRSILEIIKAGNLNIASGRVRAKLYSNIRAFKRGSDKDPVYQMQYMWKFIMKYLPKLEKEYDVAISYLWPHYFVAEKVNAKKKIAWIHTDYSVIDTDVVDDLKIWNKFDYIFAVSEECKKSFLKKYIGLKDKVMVMENITSPDFIKTMSNEKVNDNFIKDPDFKLLSVARLSHAKGIDNGVKALRLLHDRGFKDIKWYVVGYGGDEEKIRNIIKENNLEDSFVLLGKKTNPYPYMKECDLYVQPSRYEGKAVTVGEAQILCKPVVITNYSTANSQVNNNVDGYITELSVEGIADGIEKLYKDREFKNRLVQGCMEKDFNNSFELNKLYKIL
ncbi:glycosyltransferase [Clostridium sardiniense]|uniref:glycosyltransferase n=1 Tax=Clostridium sardiniense TaxID=29369 RepID=UPI003D3586FE